MTLRPGAVSKGVSTRMRKQRTVDSGPEVRVRRALFTSGLRYRKQVPVPDRKRRTIDIAFPGAKLAVFIDGCFWHGCPEHRSKPKHNHEWWRAKLEGNRQRDVETDQILVEKGWKVMRFWEHDDPATVASVVSAYIASRRMERRHG